jgi:F0F1-type ATP synthase membrane subunit c/vacuolar-type H+-ATPase subunit K
MNPETEANRELRVLMIIWVAMLAALPLYLIMGLLAAPQVQAGMNGETFSLLRKALYAVAVVTLLAIGTVRRLFCRGFRQEGGQTPAPVVLQRYRGAVIVSLAMSESIGIYGLVLFLLGKNRADLLLLLGAAAAAMIYYRPKAEDLTG